MARLFLRALRSGARQISESACEWHCEGNCSAAYPTDIVGRPRDREGGQEGYWHHFKGGKHLLRVTLWTRCRKCDNCRKARANLWRFRAREELRAAGRTWFGTLTLSPINQYRMLVEARAQAATKGVEWRTLSDEERFKRVANASGKEVTRYLKRVRKQSRVPIRYICVTERHKSGLPHFHLLVHEVELKPVKHRILSDQWTYGFEKWKLLPHDDVNGAGYVTKYLTKHDAGRIRASTAYGTPQATVGRVVASLRTILNDRQP